MCLIVESMVIIATLDTKRFQEVIHPLLTCFVLGTTSFIVLMQLFYVVPQLFDTGGVMYKFSWLVAGFISFNIVGNMCACSRTDCSVMGLPWKRRFPSPGEKSLWHYCGPCQRLMPPRSWHCKLCKRCILKRDHHCFVTGNCIGHNNQRYFFWFTFYMTLGLLLALGAIFLVLLENYDFRYVVKWICPVVCDLNQLAIGPSPPIWLDLAFAFNAFILLAPLMMFILQVLTLFNDSVVCNLYNDTYDQGLRQNLRSVLGERALWTFLSPTVESPLAHDGTQWPGNPLSEVVSIKDVV